MIVNGEEGVKCPNFIPIKYKSVRQGIEYEILQSAFLYYGEG